MYECLSVIQVIISLVLIFLVLLHSGAGPALSGACCIAGGGSSRGGGSMVERGRDRATIFFAIIWVLNTFVLLKIYEAAPVDPPASRLPRRGASGSRRHRLRRGRGEDL